MDRRDSFTPDVCGDSVLRTSARILVPVNDMNPIAIADSAASHVILPQTALYDTKAAKPVNLRLATGEINAVEAHREIFAEHVTIPLCPLGRVSRKLQLTAIWTPQTLTLNCVNKSGTAQGLTQCPIKGDTPYFTAVQFWMLRRALQLQHKGQKHFPPQFWKQLYLKAISEGPDLRMAAKAVEKESQHQTQLAPTEFLCHQDTTRSRATSNCPDERKLQTSSAFRSSSLSSNGINGYGIKSTTQRYQRGR